MIKFDCKYHFEWERDARTWKCSISRLIYFGSHLEIVVQTNEAVAVIVGRTTSGFFVYFRSHESGIDLPSLFDVYENVGRISQVCFDEEKAATIAFAIKRVGHLLSSARRRGRTSSRPMCETPF